MIRVTPRNREKWIHRAAWLVAIVLGLHQTWVYRFTMSVDGVSYVDIADNLSRGDWTNSVTGHWSPLFPAVLALPMALARPTAYWEFPLIHGVEFVLYVGALAAFTFLLAELARLRDQDSAKGTNTLVPRDLLLVFGYAMFLWSTLTLITVYGVTPDVLGAGITYLAAALVVRIRRGAAGTSAWLLLGMTLSLAYLARTILLLAGPVFLAAAFLVDPDRRAARRRLALAMGLWLVVASPWIGILSEVKGRVTIGDAGRNTHVWHVGEVTPLRHWQGGPPGYGEPLHPTRQIYTNPQVYEFGEPVDGTYPPWYDPSYWYEGVRLHFSVSRQMLAVLRSLLLYLPMVDVLLLGWFMLFLIGIRSRKDIIRTFSAYAFLSLPATVALLLYAMVLVEQRYVAGFLVVLFLALMLGVRLPSSDPSRRIYRAVVFSITLVLMADLGLTTLVDFRRSLEPTERWAWPIAVGLRRIGVEPGERVAWIGSDLNPAWARAARVKIVAEIPGVEARSFWSADQEVREEILDMLAAAGADAVYAAGVLPGAPTTGWTKIGQWGFARSLEQYR